MQQHKATWIIKTLIVSLLTLTILSCNAQNKTMTEKEFAKAYLDALQDRFPDVKYQLNPDLSITATGEKRDFQHFIENAYAVYKIQPDSITYIINQHVASAGRLYNTGNSEIDIRQIVPVIKPTEYLQEINALNQNGAAVPLITKTYNNELIIVYAEDSETSIRYLTESDFETISITLDSLNVLALENLNRILPEIQQQGGGGKYMISVGGNYEASLVLLSTIWTKENFPVDGDIVIAIPTRDLLLVTGSKNTDALNQIKGIITEEYQTGAYPISEFTYKWTGQKFEKHQ